MVERYSDYEDKAELKRLRYVGLKQQDHDLLKMEAILKVVIYARYSSDMQREESIDAQIRYCKQEIERNPNMVLVGVYYDEALSGKFDDREDFQNMIADAKEHHFDQIMVHKFNRFARNQYDSIVYKKKLREIGIRVVSATQKVDDSPEGQMTEAIIEVLDQYYSANLAEEVLKGMRENALKGISTGGRPPIGYKYDENRFLAVDEATAPIVRKLFNMYLEGYGMLSIANMLNAMGLRSQTGNEFRGRTISDILSNEKYIGTNIYHIGEEAIRRENNHTPIIDMDTWNAVQRLKMERSKPRMGSQIVYYLTGKMFCGECNGSYSGGGSKVSNGSKGKFRNYYYVCCNKRNKNCSNRAVNKGKIERHLCDHILKRILNDETIEAVATEFEKAVHDMMKASATVPIETLKKERNSLNKKIGKLLDLYLDDESDMDKEELNQRTKAHKKQLKAIDAQIRAAEVDYSKALKKEDAIKYLQDFRTSYDESSKAFVKAMLDTFIDKVIVYHDRLDITYKVDIPSGLNNDSRGDNVRLGRPNLTLEPLFFKESLTRKNLAKVVTPIEYL